MPRRSNPCDIGGRGRSTMKSIVSILIRFKGGLAIFLSFFPALYASASIDTPYFFGLTEELPKEEITLERYLSYSNIHDRTISDELKEQILSDAENRVAEDFKILKE